MKAIRRICMYSGPGGGKSTVATYLFSQLKIKGYKIEFVREYIKLWTYIPRVPKGFDSVYIQAKQIYEEDIILRTGMKYIVTDSPILLQYFYANHHKEAGKNSMLKLAEEFEKIYPSLNIFLTRRDEDYHELGRYETLEQAKVIDNKLKILLDKLKVKYKEFPYYREEEILVYILNHI